jgi:hypothetical protein
MSGNLEDEARLAQYHRLAEDWRHISNLIWQMPSLAIALMAAILGVSYQFLGPFPRALLLAVGSIFLFSLSVAVAKHRLFHESTAVFMRELEDKFNIKKFQTEGIVQLLVEDLCMSKIAQSRRFLRY